MPAQEENLSRFSKLPVVLFLGLMVLGLAACNEDELNRPLSYDKGVYGGAEDRELDEAERRELRRRGDLQRF